MLNITSQGNLGLSIILAFGLVALWVGIIIGIIYISEEIRK